MAGGLLNNAMARVKASTAGHTYVVGAEPSPGAPVAGTVTETVRRIIPTASGALDSLFRMEPTAAPVASPALVQPTTASVGPHGGLVPSGLSHLFSGAPAASPGPGPELAPAPGAPLHVPALGGVQLSPTTLRDDLVTTGLDAKTKGTHWLSTVRRRLGV
jgi:hypothetical protein